MRVLIEEKDKINQDFVNELASIKETIMKEYQYQIKTLIGDNESASE